MRVVGLDIHRVFAEAVMLENGAVRRLGRIGMTRDHLTAFAKTLTHDDHVVVEATGNASAVAEVIRPHVGRVVIANPRQVRLIAEARIKTDVIDATVLARLYASGFLPEVWIPDEATLALRRQVTRRTQIVRQRTRLKTMVQSILHAHLVPPCPHADLFGPRGRTWLLAQPLPGDESDAVARHLREYDRLSEDLKVVERELAREARADANVTRLMTIPGIDLVVAVGLIAAIGPVARFAGPDRLVAYLAAPSLWRRHRPDIHTIMLNTSTARQKIHPVASSISQKFGTSTGYAEAVLDLIVNGWKDHSSVEELYAQNPESRVYLDYSLGAMWRGRQVVQRIKALHPNPKRALDIGSGSGGVLVALAEQGINVLGVELEPHLVALSKLAAQDFNCVEVISANVLASDTASWGKFDVICCNAVIEHVLNPERLLSQIGSLLADGGVVHIEIPNKNCVSNIIQDLHYQMFGLQLLPRSGALSLHRSLMPGTDYTVGEFFDLEWYQSRLGRLNISTELLINDWGSRYENAEADLGRLWASFDQWNQQAENEDNYLLRHELRRRFLRYFSDACSALAAAHEGNPDCYERKYGAMAWVLVGGWKPHSY